MERFEELAKLLTDDNKATVRPLLKKMVFLEQQLETLEKLPMIKVNPDNPAMQKTTPAAKLYKEFLQQYNNIIKTVTIICGRAEADAEDSPLRAWVKSRGESNAD